MPVPLPASTDTPACVLPEITLPCAAVLPPTRVLLAPRVRTPTPLARLAVPAALRPIQLPITSVPCAPSSTATPTALPAIRLRSGAVVPPMRVPVVRPCVPFCTHTPPWMKLPTSARTAAVPAAFVPIRLPAMRVPAVTAAGSVALTNTPQSRLPARTLPMTSLFEPP